MTKSLIQATTLSEESLQGIIKQLVDRFDDGSSGAGGTWGRKLHDRMRWRRAHFHNMPEADPVLSEPYNDSQKDQSDLPRRTHNATKARLLENHFQFAARPKMRDTGDTRKAADKVASWLNMMVKRLEEQRGVTLQSALADGQGIRGFGLLHWRARPDLLPSPTKDGYTEEERAEEIAANPYLVDIETPDPLNFYWLPDRRMENQIGVGLLIESVGLLNYNDEAKDGGWGVHVEEGHLSVMDVNPDLPIGEEMPAPIAGSPSGGQWGERVAKATVWTRNEWYELVRYIGDVDLDVRESASWLLVQSGPHASGVVPFAIATANQVAIESDPALQYEPYLEGVFRKKPVVDRLDALEMALAELTALPTYYLEQIEGGARKLDEAGDPVIFSQNAASAMTIPEGWTLKKVDITVEPGFNAMVAGKRQELVDAGPPSGRAQFGAGDTVWKARLEMTQENVEPKMWLANMALAFQVMGRSILRCVEAKAEDGGYGESIYYTYEDPLDEGVRRQEQISPEDVKGIELAATINNVSSAEQLTVEEHGRSHLDDPLMPLTPEQFLKKYMNDPNPRATLIDWEGWKIWEQYVKPGKVAQLVAKMHGSSVVMGVNGEVIGPDGQPQALEDFAASQGITPMAGTTQGPGEISQIGPPSGGPLQVPGTLPVSPGVPG